MSSSDPKFIGICQAVPMRTTWEEQVTNCWLLLYKKGGILYSSESMDVIIKGTPRPGHKKGQSMLYLCKMSKTPKLMHENDDSCDKLLDSFKNCFIGYEHFAKAFDVSLDKLAVSISSFDQLLDAVKAVWPGVNIMKIVFSRDKWEEVIGFYDETAKPISERTRARLISAIKERMD